MKLRAFNGGKLKTLKVLDFLNSNLESAYNY